MAKLVVKGSDGQEFKIDDLVYFELYLKLLKDTNVYWYPSAEKKYFGWTAVKGQILGKTFSFVSEYDEPLAGVDIETFKRQRKAAYPLEAIKGVWLTFKVNGDPTKQTYYWKYEKNTIDWFDVERQLTAAEKRNLNWYQGYFYDMEKAISSLASRTWTGIKDGLTYGLTAGAAIIIGWVLWKNYQHRKQLNEFKEIAREVGRGTRDK